MRLARINWTFANRFAYRQKEKGQLYYQMISSTNTPFSMKGSYCSADMTALPKMRRAVLKGGKCAGSETQYRLLVLSFPASRHRVGPQKSVFQSWSLFRASGSTTRRSMPFETLHAIAIVCMCSVKIRLLISVKGARAARFSKVIHNPNNIALEKPNVFRARRS